VLGGGADDGITSASSAAAASIRFAPLSDLGEWLQRRLRQVRWKECLCRFTQTY
jgi:hypothetical protein